MLSERTTSLAEVSNGLEHNIVMPSDLQDCAPFTTDRHIASMFVEGACAMICIIFLVKIALMINLPALFPYALK